MLQWVLLCLALGACTGPTLTVRVEPGESNLFVDGRRHPGGELPFRYYGDVRLQVEPPIEEGSEFRYLGVERMVEVNEPVTPWLFPLDFGLELILRGFNGAGDDSVDLALGESPTRVIEGLEPAGAEEVRARSARARTSR